MAKARDDVNINASNHNLSYTRLLSKYFGMTLFNIDILIKIKFIDSEFKE
jgi:hypothetical protein